MQLQELRTLAGLDEDLEDKEIASEMTKLLGLFRIAVKKIERDRLHLGDDYVGGWLDAERALNTLAVKEFRGTKRFK